ncbi:MAG: hypothetical protein RIC55_34320 [Pirellulaceae bacterium]
MPDTPEQLRQQMAQLRSEVRDDVESVFDTAEELTDWRHYVRRYPWAVVSAAAAVGFLLAPSQRSEPRLDYDALLKHAQKQGLVVECEKAAVGQTGWFRGAIGLAGPLLARAAMSYAGQKLGAYLEDAQDGS